MVLQKDLRLTEVAQSFDVDVTTVRNWISLGLLNAFRLPGGQWRVSPEEVERIRRSNIGGA